MVRKGRFEVAVPGLDRARVPDGLCAACGVPFGVEALRSGRRLELPFARRAAALPRYYFPLCDDCGRAHAAAREGGR